MAGTTDDITPYPNGNDDDRLLKMMQVIITILANYAWIVAVIFGIPGNILSVLIATRKRNRGLSPCIYITAMAVVDTALLVQLAWLSLFFSDIGKTFLTDRGIIFRVVVYTMTTFGTQSGFFQAAMSVDRLIAVRWPMAAPRLCSTPRAKKIVITTFLATAVFNIKDFFTVKYVLDQATGVEFLVVSTPGDDERLKVLLAGVDIFVGNILPFSIIFSCNVIIVITIKQASKQRRLMKSGLDTNAKDTQYLTRMLLLISAAYMVTSLPYRWYEFMIGIPGVASYYDLTKPYWSLRHTLELWAVYDLWCCNYAVNFYLYCLGGGKRYRDDLKQLFKRKPQ
ncbi:cysteinyl leukotriene receptor 1-like [Lineus longissimus]|uniref:cysteinyl leukotriene receptor 1-like n=1 Tax=Lineus longissimus TaxID=88925 RepID=UPI00315D1249